MLRRTQRLIAALALFALGLVAFAGCSSGPGTTLFQRFGPQPPSPPPANSPSNVVRLLQWCWEHRDDVTYRQVFTADYTFQFANSDSAGSFYRVNPWGREDELTMAHHLFVSGSPSDAPASSITMTFVPDTLPAEQDTRPGMGGPAHRMIHTFGNLTILKTDGTAYALRYGDWTFYVVRGDSADIPRDIGAAPDPGRWYVQRWAEADPAAVPARVQTPTSPQPTRRVTIGQIKVLYR